MKRRRHKLLAILGFVLYLLALCACQPKEKERVCIHITTTNGREYTTGIQLPKSWCDLRVNSSQCLQYKDQRWWSGKWVTVKEGVEDYYFADCKY